MKFWAFIAHSGRDARFARRLHRKLESYAIPASLIGQPIGADRIPKRLAPVFLDRAELSGGSDLKRSLEDQLRESRALVVVCSPSAAVSAWVEQEIRDFQDLGGQDRVIPAILDPGPRGMPRDAMPSALLRRRNPDGSVSEVEPIAADFRKDGFNNAKLKIVAGILGISFDSLKQRDRVRKRRQTAAAAVASVVGVAAALLVYALVADRGASIPYAEKIRSAFDACDCSIARRVPSHADLVLEASAVRRTLIGYELQDLEKDGEVLVHYPGGRIGGTWQLGQIAKGIADAPEATPAELARTKHGFDPPFEPGGMTLSGGINFGWLRASAPGNPQAEAALWPILGLSALLARPGALTDSERAVFRDRLRLAESAAWMYFGGLEGPDAGGWRHLPRETDPHAYALYTTITGLDASLALRRAGERWPREGRDLLPEMIRSTIAYLSRTYDRSPLWKYPGWHGTQASRELTPSSGLTLLAYTVLLKAELSPDHAGLSEAFAQDMGNRLTGLAPDDFDPLATEQDDLRAEFTGPDGKTTTGEYRWKIPWYPYAVEFAQLWIDHLERIHAGNANMVEARRVLAKLVSRAQEVTGSRTGIYRGEYLLHLDSVH